jgi:predicted short-subunit dehydrogenase-like oxidoreductase (DUF2520 family)
MEIGIIGAGNVAHVFATQLHNASVSIRGIYSTNSAQATTLANTIGCTCYSNAQQLAQLVDIVILAVPDDALTTLGITTNALVIHTSGATPIDVLHTYSNNYGCMWPIMSLRKELYHQYNNLPIVVNGNTPRAEELILQLAQSITPYAFVINQQQKPYAHLMATLVNNFTNALYTQAQGIGAQQQIPFTLFMPIIQQQVQLLASTPAAQLQTGAAIRKDETTINTHLQLLKDNKHLYNLYQQFTELIQANK